MRKPVFGVFVRHKPVLRPRPSGLGEIDGLHGTSTQSCILTYDLCTGEPLRRPKPAQDEWYVIMSGHPFIKALAAYWGGAFVQGLRCHFISMPGKSPMKLDMTIAVYWDVKHQNKTKKTNQFCLRHRD